MNIKNLFKKTVFCLSIMLIVLASACNNDNEKPIDTDPTKKEIIDNVKIECYQRDNLYITGYNKDVKVDETALETGKCYYMLLSFDINPYYNQYRDTFSFAINYDGAIVEVDETNTSKVVPNKQSYELRFSYVLPGESAKSIQCGINIAILDKGYVNFSSPEARFYQEYKINKGDYKYIIENDNSVGVVGCYIDTTDIEIPSNAFGVDVTKVAYTNITNWQDMTSIKFPDTLKMIDNETFKGCACLKEMYIPTSVEKIGNNVFDGCISLTKITVSKDNKVFDSRDNCNAIIETKTEKLMYGCVNTKIPDSIKIIGGAAFKNISNISAIDLPSRLERIEGEAFYNCNLITELIFPSTLSYVGSYAFYGCSEILKINLPKSLTTLGYGAFEGCTKLTELTIPAVYSTTIDYLGYYFGIDNVKNNGNNIPESLKKITCYFSKQEINDSYFYNCSNVEEIIVNGTIKTIGSSAFNNCKKLKTIQFEKKIEVIKDKAFYDCNSLEAFDFCITIQSIGDLAFFRCKKINEVLLLENVTELGEGAFSSCEGLTKILIPVNVTKIGEKVLYGCKNLVEVEIPFTGNGDDKTNFGYLFGSSTYDDNETYLPKTLTSVIVRKGKYVDVDAFNQCVSIKTITIPDTIEEIKEKAFFGCSSLENINTPKSLKRIGNEAFRGCTKLEKFDFVSGISSIGDLAFYSCVSLTSLNISSTITTIGSRSFGYCSSLSEIKVDANNTIYDSRNNSNSINVTATNSMMFGCKNTAIDSSITKIEEYAFDGATGLNELSIPTTITVIGFSALVNCSGLETLTMPSLVNGTAKHLGFYFGTNDVLENSKYVSRKLITVTLLSDENIADYAFYDCAAIKTVNLPNTIKTIGEKAFSKCINLTKINYNGTQANWNGITKADNWALDSNNLTITFKN